MATGLDRLAAGDSPLPAGDPVALVCHPASVDRQLRHAIDVVRGAGLRLVSLLGPEHGIDAAAQDMEVVEGEQRGAVVPTYNLYGDAFESLRPRPEQFHGARWLVCDLQDVGARYYTYVWTMMLAAEVALEAGMRVLILDRPNPLGGLDEWVEGGLIASGEESFVGLHSVCTRHGMTVGELLRMSLEERGVPGLDRFEVLRCTGWSRDMFFGATGLPWVLPSPNMPTMDTALVYPGQCLFEGTTLSEGRGTTRPFELFGAPWVDGEALARSLSPEEHPGLALRACTFKPMFQKPRRCGLRWASSCTCSIRRRSAAFAPRGRYFASCVGKTPRPSSGGPSATSSSTIGPPSICSRGGRGCAKRWRRGSRPKRCWRARSPSGSPSSSGGAASCSTESRSSGSSGGCSGSRGTCRVA